MAPARGLPGWPKKIASALLRLFFIALHRKAIKTAMWAVPGHGLKILSARPREWADARKK